MTDKAVAPRPLREHPVSRRASHMRQTCKVCGAPDKFNFHISNELWVQVVPAAYLNGVVCLYCFDEFARDRGVAYARALEEVRFAGEKANFLFRVVSAVDL